jgi:hypothetical protein
MSGRWLREPQQRDQPAVGLASGGDAYELGPSFADILGIGGPLPRIYVLTKERLLSMLARLVGRSFALLVGTARIWRPDVALPSDPERHPLVIRLFEVCGRGLRGEFACVFDLGHPVVRPEIAEIEAARKRAEHQLWQLRNASGQTLAPALVDGFVSTSVDQHRRRSVREARHRSPRVRRPGREGCERASTERKA